MPLSDDFLKKYRLKNLPPLEREAVESAASRTEKCKNQRLNRSDPALLLQNYLTRIHEVLDRKDPRTCGRGLEKLKVILHRQFIIDSHHPIFDVSSPERIREILSARRNGKDQPIDANGKPYTLSHFDKRIIRFSEEGRGLGTVPEEERQNEINDIVDEQIKTFDTWIDYLTCDDAKYPDPLKYWVFRSILKMGRFDKKKNKFTNREGKGSVSPFPELNREALTVICEDMEKKYTGNPTLTFTSRYDIELSQKQSYQQALDKEDFSTLYALVIDAFKPIAEDLLRQTSGVWFPFPQGSDPMTFIPTATVKDKTIKGKPLVPSISDYGTGWCLRGEPTARRYLENNALSIYYSNDSKGSPTVPRVVMVINAHNQITEVRGIAAHEHLDPYIGDIVQHKLNEHPDGQKYMKKSNDMKLLTDIDHLIKSGVFDSPDFIENHQEERRRMLTFLYEVDFRIEGFGYEAAGRDPRIEEIRSQRNPKEDLSILFDCQPSQIALIPKEISLNTKAYIGKLEPGIFRLLEKNNVEHIYTSFPEGRIHKESLEIGTLTAKELETKLDEKDSQGNRTLLGSSYARSMLQNKKEFITPINNRHRERNGNPETINLIRLRVRDFGFTTPPTTKELFARAKKYGLELCPPETGPLYLLSHPDQPMGDWFYVGMEPVAGSDGYPSVFNVLRSEGGPELGGSWARPDRRWLLDDSFVFRVGKSDS